MGRSHSHTVTAWRDASGAPRQAGSARASTKGKLSDESLPLVSQRARQISSLSAFEPIVSSGQEVADPAFTFGTCPQAPRQAHRHPVPAPTPHRTVMPTSRTRESTVFTSHTQIKLKQRYTLTLTAVSPEGSGDNAIASFGHAVGAWATSQFSFASSLCYTSPRITEVESEAPTISIGICLSAAQLPLVDAALGQATVADLGSPWGRVPLAWPDRHLRFELQYLQDFAAHLHDAEVEEQAARLNNLADVLSSGLRDQKLVEFLRGAVGAASTIATFSPALPAPPAADGPQPSDVALAASLPAVVAQATCAGCAVYGLLGSLRDALSRQCDLPPDVIFRLTAACGVALCPIISAAHVAYQYAAAFMRPASQAQAARCLTRVCAVLLDVAYRVEGVLAQLGTAKPAAALRATACRPAHFVELYCKASTILEWCCRVLGPTRRLWHPLACLTALREGALKEACMDGESQVNICFGSLLAAYDAALLQCLLRVPLPLSGDVDLLQQWRRMWVLACSLLGERIPRLPGSVAASMAGALLRLLQLRRTGADVAVCFDLLGVTMGTLNRVNTWALQDQAGAAVQLQQRQQQQRQQQQQQQQPRQQQQSLLPACMEWAAVGAATLAALVEMYEEGPAQCGTDAGGRLASGMRGYLSMLVELVPALTSCHQVLPAEMVSPGIEACEAMLRLCGALLRLLRSAHCRRGSGLASEAARLYSYSTNAVSSLALACILAIRGWGAPFWVKMAQQPAPASLGHLAATAVKLGRLVAELWQQGAAPQPDRDAQHVDEDILLVAIMCLVAVVEVCCKWPEDGSQVQPRAISGSRCLEGTVAEGAVAALASSIARVQTVLPHVQKRKSGDEGTGVTAGRMVATMAAALGALDSRVGQQGGAQELQQLAGVQVHLVTFLHEAFMEVCQLPGASTATAAAMADAATPIIEHATTWNRSAVVAVSKGLLDAAVGWAVASTGTATRARNSIMGLERVWEMFLAVANALVRHMELQQQQQQQQQLDNADQADFQAWRQQIWVLQQLPAASHREQLHSKGFWKRQVREGQLRGMKSVVEIAGGVAEQPLEQQLQIGLTLVAQACANPTCMNLRGASEGRLRCRRCSGCGVARFCSTECFEAGWPAHSRACRALRAEEQ